MKRWRILGVPAVVAVLIGMGGAPTGAALPVSYNFFGGIPNELTSPGGSLPGSNDWHCKPTAAHPEPVVLVHGTGGGAQTNWGTYVPLLANEGYCVFALTYGAYQLPWPISAVGGMLPVEDSAAQLGAFVDRVLAATGAQKVDIVGHSQGTLMPNYWVKRLGGAAKVDKYVSLAPLWHGTNAFEIGDLDAYLRRLGVGAAFDAAAGTLCKACMEMVRDAPFLTALDKDGVYAPGVSYTNIMDVYDEAVVPYASGSEPAPNATNIVVQDGCGQDYSEHAAVAADPRAAAYVLNALDPSHPHQVPCEFVPPFVG